jgi:hypothetical protein
MYVQVEQHTKQVEQLAQVLLQRETVLYQDVLELLGPRPEGARVVRDDESLQSASSSTNEPTASPK